MNYLSGKLFSTGILLILIVIVACGKDENNIKKESKQKKKSGESIQQVKLPYQLTEISGIAVTPDGRLFGHDDEEGVIYEIDSYTGNIVKRFQLGSFGLEGDFEGLAILDSNFYIVESNGSLYEFKEGGNKRAVKINKLNSRFSSKYEIEGLCFGKDKDKLLLACKSVAGKKNKGYRFIFAYSVKKNSLIQNPFLKIHLDELENKLGGKSFFPSGIEYNSKTDSYFLLSSKGEKAVAEISSEGKVLSVIKLKDKLHKQPEGITFLSDGSMVISDEGAGKKATLTIYPVRNK